MQLGNPQINLSACLQTTAVSASQYHNPQPSTSLSATLVTKIEQHQKVQSILLQAIQDKDLPTIIRVKTLNADFNENDPRNGTSPLGKALVVGDLQVISLVIKQGAQPNIEDLNGDTAGDIALRIGKLPFLKLLQEHGADFDLVHTDGQNYWTQAVNTDNMIGFDLLKNLGADIDNPDGNGMTPLALATCLRKPHVCKKLKDLHADPILSNEIILAKSLAAFWGFGSDIHLKDSLNRDRTVALEGFCPTITYPMITEAFECFLHSAPQAATLSTDETSDILQSFKNGSFSQGIESAETMLRKIQSNVPFVMLQLLSEHVLGLVFSKNKLAICNRGDGTETGAPGITIYSLNTDALTVDQIQVFLEAKNTDAFLEILEALKQKPFDMHQIAFFKQKKQETGNCSVASVKSLLFALIYIICESRIIDPIKRRDVAVSIYKPFTAFLRWRPLAFYLRYSSQPNTDILDSVLQVIEFKTHIPLPIRSQLTEKTKEIMKKNMTMTRPKNEK